MTVYTYPVTIVAQGIAGCVMTVIPGTAGSPEDVYLATGVRPILPILSYFMGAFQPADVDGVTPFGGQFVVSDAFIGGPSDPFSKQGAQPGSIGTRLQNSAMATYYVFRAPIALEVVWSIADNNLYRYLANPVSGVVVWQLYRSRAERNLLGQRVFAAYDPNGVLAYFARLVGAMYYQLNYDNQVLRDLTDPDKVAPFWLSELAKNYGVTFLPTDSVAVQRAKTETAVAVSQLRGLEAGIELRLRTLGYLGYAREIWVNPTNGSNYESAVINPDGSPSSSPTGAGTDWIEVPHGYYWQAPTTYWPSSRIAIHVTDFLNRPVVLTLAEMQLIALSLHNDVLPANVDIRVFDTDYTLVDDGLGLEDSFFWANV